jgi:hypothetical protein
MPQLLEKVQEYGHFVAFVFLLVAVAVVVVVGGGGLQVLSQPGRGTAC